MPRPARMRTGTSCSASAGFEPWIVVYSVDMVIAERLAMLTSERSMPPVSIASIIAMASTPTSGADSARFCRFSVLRKTLGRSAAKNTNATTSSTSMRPVPRLTCRRSMSSEVRVPKSSLSCRRPVIRSSPPASGRGRRRSAGACGVAWPTRPARRRR